MSVGIPKTHCAAKSNGDGSTARVVTRDGGSDRPSRSSRNVNSPPAASVALVNTTVSTRSNSASFRTGARSSGTADSVRLGGRLPRRSIHRTAGPGGGREADGGRRAPPAGRGGGGPAPPRPPPPPPPRG